MTEKRYFERKWEEEYYIFDSEVISETEFDEKVEYEDYHAFKDSMTGEEIINLLNENEQLKQKYDLVCRFIRRNHDVTMIYKILKEGGIV